MTQTPASRADRFRPRTVPVDCSERELTTDDAHRLFIRCYQPACRTGSRTLLIVHGLSEHGGRYDHVARYFAERGWRAVVGDLRGHGCSSGPRAYVRDFHRYVLDVESIRSRFGSEPEQTAILGHSMGGLIAIHYALTYPDRIAALALTSPLLRIRVPIPRRTFVMGRLLSIIAPRTRFRSRVDAAHTTRCDATLERRAADPLMNRSVTAGLFFAMRSAVTAAWNGASAVSLPVFLTQAGADRIVDPEAARDWIAALSSEDREFCRLPDHFHEVLNEPDWCETAGRMAGWLEQRTGGEFRAALRNAA